MQFNSTSFPPKAASLEKVLNHGIPVFQTATHASKWRGTGRIIISIAIISNDRLDSLKRLCDSLLNAIYSPTLLQAVDLRIIFNLESGSSPQLIDYVNDFQWEYGSKHVNRRVQRGGLIRAVSESWFPSSDNDYGLLLEDDIEVSPLYMVWIEAMLSLHLNESDHRLSGISLYSPRVTETRLENPRVPFDSNKLAQRLTGDQHFPYLMQTPCSWGALYFPGHWRQFISHMQDSIAKEANGTARRDVIPGSRTNHWKQSWKKYYFEIMHTNGWYLLYPNFRDQASFSTNHIEPGEHITTISRKEAKLRAQRYMVPLLNVSDYDSVTRIIRKLAEGSGAFFRKLPLVDLFGDPNFDKNAGALLYL